MASSQFTIYTSSDPQGPGMLTGQTGSLTNILDYCLVGGYGTGSYYKAPAGWTKPLSNVSASVGQLPQLACYRQASGSQFILFVNDSGPNVTSTAKEAWITGWEYMSSMTGSGLGNVYTASNSAGFGWGQFPTPAQQLTYGHCVVRKSVSADVVGRHWMIAADNNTMYMWILSGDSAQRYYHFAFGDIYSFAQNDRYKCMIMGRIVENSATIQNVDWTAHMAQGSGYHTSGYNAASTLTTAQPGHWLARNVAGTGGSTGFTKKGDPMTGNAFLHTSPASTYACDYSGVLQTPNAADNTFYVHPLYVIDPSAPMIRGRLRGIYHPCHAASYFANGQLITGGGDYAGKSLMCINTAPDDVGCWFLEVSNTVETNV